MNSYKDELKSVFQQACGVPVVCEVIEKYKYEPDKNYQAGVHEVYHLYTRMPITKKVDLFMLAAELEESFQEVKCRKPRIFKFPNRTYPPMIQIMRIDEDKIYADANGVSIVGYVSINSSPSTKFCGSLSAVITVDR